MSLHHVSTCLDLGFVVSTVSTCEIVPAAKQNGYEVIGYDVIDLGIFSYNKETFCCIAFVDNFEWCT